MRTRSAERPLPAMSIASKSPISATPIAERRILSRAPEHLRECLIVEPVLGQLGGFLVDAHAVAVGSGHAAAATSGWNWT